MRAHFYKVAKPAETLLIADCGTRPNTSKGGETETTGLDRNDAVYYTTDWMDSQSSTPKQDLGKLSGVMQTPWLSARIPWDRHKNKINVAFCDGHGETIQKSDASKVRISPFRF